MSHKENDKYNEELEMVEQDLKDAQEAEANALKDLQEASRWLNERIENTKYQAKRLQALKENNL